MQTRTTTPNSRQEKSAPGFTVFERLCLVQTLLLRADLDPQELAVMVEVWARSVGFGEPGVYLGTHQIAKARGMGRRTVCYVLDRLELRELISRKRGRHRTWLQINFHNIGGNMKLGTKGRESRESTHKDTQTDPEGGHHVHSDVQHVHSEVVTTCTAVNKNHTNANQEEREPKVCAATPRRLASMVEWNLKHVDKPVTGGTLAKTWKVAWARSSFAVTTLATELTPKQMGQLAHLVKPWPWEPKEIHFFLAWVITDWKRVVRELSWMKRKPEQPSPGFVLACSSSLMDLWAAKVRYDFVSDLSKDRLDRLMAGGLSEGEALAVTTRNDTPPTRKERPPTRKESEAAWGTRPPLPWKNR